MQNNGLRAFIRYNKNRIVPGSLMVSRQVPKVGTWMEIRANKADDKIYNVISN
jgi:hypothetical protein